MKKLMIFLIFLCSLQVQAACKCNCDPMDFRMCASFNDLEHPCGNVCSSQGPSLATMITACPVKLVVNQIGMKEWVSSCNQ